MSNNIVRLSYLVSMESNSHDPIQVYRNIVKLSKWSEGWVKDENKQEAWIKNKNVWTIQLRSVAKEKTCLYLVLHSPSLFALLKRYLARDASAAGSWMFDDNVWLVGPGPEVTSNPGVLPERLNGHSDGTNRVTDGTGVEPKGHVATGCFGAGLRVFND